MNIHEAVVAAQPVVAFVYCNRQAPRAGTTRPPAAGKRLNALMNSAHSLKLFYFISDVVPCSLVGGYTRQPMSSL